MNINDKIYVAGHNGLVGSAILRLLQQKGFRYLITENSADLDLRDQVATRKFFQKDHQEL